MKLHEQSDAVLSDAAFLSILVFLTNTAVNTVVRRDGQYIGENTAGRGFVNALRKFIDPAGKTVIIFGAGGAARAVAVEMALAGANRISVVNRSRKGGEELARLLNDKTPTLFRCSRASTASTFKWEKYQ